MKKKSIEFYMVVTNRSVFISNFCIPSVVKLIDNLTDTYNVIFHIYLNCINIERYSKYINKWEKHNYVKIIYSDLTPDDFLFDGNSYKATNGKKYLYPMEFEEPFDRGYSNTKADYFISIDDDFEVLNPILVVDMLRYMEEHPELPIFSTDKTITNNHYDTYSKGNIILCERNDTWFTIYNTKYNAKNVSCHPVDYYVKPNGEIRYFNFGQDNWLEYIDTCIQEKGIRYVYNGMAWLQKEIRLNTPSEIISIKDIDIKYDKMYIHFGAFTQNKSVNTYTKVKLYRFLAIKRKIGFLFLPNYINRKIKILFKMIFSICFLKADRERKLQNSNSDLD